MEKDFVSMFQEREAQFMSPFAQLSADSKGRRHDITPCNMRTCYMRDCDRITHSKSFRRLKHKTQVFFAPEGDHYRTRLTHTLEVAQIARAIARLLCLNENLTEAIALGHDLGHTPFGHSGEDALAKKTGWFEHNTHSLRVVDVLEDLNLTHEVRDGIVNHKMGLVACTLEGMCVNHADRIAYINHDIDDAIRAGLIAASDIPARCIEYFGATHGVRINTMIEGLVNNSIGKPEVRFTDEAAAMMLELRSFMFERVYHTDKVMVERDKAERLVGLLYDYFTANPERLPSVHRDRLDEFGSEQSVVDYIAGMTDGYAKTVFESIFEPGEWGI